MTDPRIIFLRRINIVVDVIACLVSLLYAAKFAGGYLNGVSLHDMLQIRFKISNLFGLMGLLLLWVLVFRARGLYQARVGAVASRQAWLDIAVACSIGTIFFAAIGFFFNITLFSKLFLLTFGATAYVVTVLARWVAQVLLKHFHLGDNNQRGILIIGEADKAWQYAAKHQLTGNVPWQAVDIYADYVILSNLPVDSNQSLRDIHALLDVLVVDEIVLTISMHAPTPMLRDTVEQARSRGITLRFPLAHVIADLAIGTSWKIRHEISDKADDIQAHDIVAYSGHVLGGSYLVKRLLDIVFSLMLILLTSPVQMMAWLAVRLSSAGTGVFVQDRYGYNGRVFRLYKFRTMVNHAESLQDDLLKNNERHGPAFKMKNDPRVTSVGRLLRKTSIDELPQLYNVLKGEMSIVGPRPLPLADYQRMDKGSHRRRLSVLPGITGPWQVSDRENVSFDDWMRMDLEYVDHWSLLTDIKIVAKTVPIVLFGRGAS